MQLSVKDVADNANTIINGYAYTKDDNSIRHHKNMSYVRQEFAKKGRERDSCCGRKEDGQNNRRTLSLWRIRACTV